MLATLLTALAAAGPASVVVLPTVSLSGPSEQVPDGSIVASIDRALTRQLAADLTLELPLGGAAPTPPSAVVPPALAALSKRADAARANLDYAVATRALVDLCRGLEEQLEDIGDVGPLVDARLALANLYFARDQDALAEGELVRVARLRPALELDPRRHPPRVTDAFARARERVDKEPAARLNVAVEPIQSVVFLDGVAIGETPLDIQIPRGPHLLFVGAQGHSAMRQRLDVAPRGFVKIEDQLVEARSFTLARQLMQSLRQPEDARGEQLARSLTAEMNAQATIVSGVLRGPAGYVLVISLVDEERRSWVTSIDVGLDTLDAVVGETAAELTAALQQDGPAHGTVGPATATVAATEDESAHKALALNFDAHLLGQGRPTGETSPAEPRTAARDDGPTGTDAWRGQEGGDASPAEAELALWPYALGAGAGVAALLAAALVSGAVAGGLLFSQQRPLVVDDVPRRTVAVPVVTP